MKKFNAQQIHQLEVICNSLDIDINEKNFDLLSFAKDFNDKTTAAFAKVAEIDKAIKDFKESNVMGGAIAFAKVSIGGALDLVMGDIPADSKTLPAPPAIKAEVEVKKETPKKEDTKDQELKKKIKALDSTAPTADDIRLLRSKGLKELVVKHGLDIDVDALGAKKAKVVIIAAFEKSENTEKEDVAEETTAEVENVLDGTDEIVEGLEEDLAADLEDSADDLTIDSDDDEDLDDDLDDLDDLESELDDLDDDLDDLSDDLDDDGIEGSTDELDSTDDDLDDLEDEDDLDDLDLDDDLDDADDEEYEEERVSAMIPTLTKKPQRVAKLSTDDLRILGKLLKVKDSDTIDAKKLAVRVQKVLKSKK